MHHRDADKIKKHFNWNEAIIISVRVLQMGLVQVFFSNPALPLFQWHWIKIGYYELHVLDPY